MQDELVQMASLVAEARLAVTALLGRAELVLEERVVLGADDGEVIRHGFLSVCLQRSVIGVVSFSGLCLLFLRIASSRRGNGGLVNDYEQFG